MKKFKEIILQSMGIFLFFYFVYGVLISVIDIRVLKSDLSQPNPPGFYDYKGVINVHSKASTGSGSIEDIVQSAQEQNLDFIFVTDLNDFTPNRSMQGYQNNLLVSVDGEFSYLNSRLLHLNSNLDPEVTGSGAAHIFFANRLSQKLSETKSDFLALSHPLKSGYEWKGNLPTGLDGMEIINLKAMWQESWTSHKASVLWTFFIYPFNPRSAIIRLIDSPEREIKFWDESLARQTIFGFAGADAEALIHLGGIVPVKFPTYSMLFSIFRNHLLLKSELTGNFESDRAKLMSALRSGQFYFSLDLLANPQGFNAVIKSPKNQIFPMGSSVRLTSGQVLKVQLPRRPLVPFEIAIYLDGQKIVTTNQVAIEHPISKKGIYRVMVRVIPTFPLPDGKRWIPWIFTNPFLVR